MERLVCVEYHGLSRIILLVKGSNLVLPHIVLFYVKPRPVLVNTVNQLLFDGNAKCPIT